jgi:hypothetical protein
MHLAAQHGHLEVVRLLLDKGANKEAANKVQCAPPSPQIAWVLEGLHYSPTHQSLSLQLQDGFTPLHSAAQHGHLEVVRLLLDKGANKEAANKVGLWLGSLWLAWLWGLLGYSWMRPDTPTKYPLNLNTAGWVYTSAQGSPERSPGGVAPPAGERRQHGGCDQGGFAAHGLLGYLICLVHCRMGVHLCIAQP